MREKARIERILSLLGGIWSEENKSDQRFGQFLINLGIAADHPSTWYKEDDELEKALKDYLKKNAKDKRRYKHGRSK